MTEKTNWGEPYDSIFRRMMASMRTASYAPPDMEAYEADLRAIFDSRVRRMDFSIKIQQGDKVYDVCPVAAAFLAGMELASPSEMSGQEIEEEMARIDQIVGDAEEAHIAADDLLLDLVNRREVTLWFRNLRKWYA